MVDTQIISPSAMGHTRLYTRASSLLHKCNSRTGVACAQITLAWVARCY